MNVKKFIPNIALAITLISLSSSAEGFQRISNYVLAGIIALAAIVLLFEKKSSKPIWKSIVRCADDLDLTYVAFGLGLILISREFSSITWASLSLLLSGVVFAGAGIGKLIGTGGAEVLKANAKIGIVIGFLFLIAGGVVCILTWNSIVEKPLVNTSYPILMICVGIAFIYFGWRKLYKKARPLKTQTPLRADGSVP
jgi:hypothetical protein